MHSPFEKRTGPWYPLGFRAFPWYYDPLSPGSGTMIFRNCFQAFSKIISLFYYEHEHKVLVQNSVSDP
jgi:hypothetical protein